VNNIEEMRKQVAEYDKAAKIAQEAQDKADCIRISQNFSMYTVVRAEESDDYGDYEYFCIIKKSTPMVMTDTYAYYPVAKGGNTDCAAGSDWTINGIDAWFPDIDGTETPAAAWRAFEAEYGKINSCNSPRTWDV